MSVTCVLLRVTVLSLCVGLSLQVSQVTQDVQLGEKKGGSVWSGIKIAYRVPYEEKLHQVSVFIVDNIVMGPNVACRIQEMAKSPAAILKTSMSILK